MAHLEKQTHHVTFQVPESQMTKSGSIRYKVPNSILQRETENPKDLFIIGRRLGAGQFGTTYSCTEKATGKEYACKVIPKRKLLLKEDAEDVRREIQIMHLLSGHPNIVDIKGAYEDTGNVYMVMELCAGGELFDRITQRGHYSEAQASAAIRAILEAIEICHELGVFHRDLKPENFLLADKDEDAPLKVIDFGLSTYFKIDEVFTDIVGSPYYIAPEVLLRNYGPEADVWSAGVILYILLSGIPPFWAENEDAIFKLILTSDVVFMSETWKSISLPAKDLIQKMLIRNPLKRPTAREALMHPWIQEDGVAPDVPMDPIVQCRLKKFSAMNKLKKMAIRVIAENLSEEEIAGLKEIFKMVDTDNSSTITFEELKIALRRFGSVLKDSEIHDLLDAADVDQNGIIDYGEFIAATISLNKVSQQENLHIAFQYFDRDNSGYITKDELQQACVEHHLKDVQVDDMIKELDKDNDGRIDYNEFSAMFTRVNSGLSRRASRNSLRSTFGTC
ncbi:calcium-dependent protein kinase [Marchantia polymorpha subsp. ruderalis]